MNHVLRNDLVGRIRKSPLCEIMQKKAWTLQSHLVQLREFMQFPSSEGFVVNYLVIWRTT